jgi:hypothetical protein
MAFIKDSVADATSLTRLLANSCDGGRKPVEQEGEFAAGSVGENPWSPHLEPYAGRAPGPAGNDSVDSRDHRNT